MATVLELRRRAGLSQRELAELSGVAQPNIAAYESGRRRPSPRMLERLEAAAKPRPSMLLTQHARAVTAIARKHNAVDVRVFGSVARGDDRPGSDVDLLVTFATTATLYDQVALTDELEALLGIHVDVVSSAGLGARHDNIGREARPL
ncbi:MAG: helix-turn-helix domain-containing protein [Actinobacteria bacterium]|nr:helix-turn-helix domain-containing protein [Actinomycetota bacterium]HRY08971.1 helix-turn-helix domain-containing protein [Candidatus Nanopelagicales bacterium]